MELKQLLNPSQVYAKSYMPRPSKAKAPELSCVQESRASFTNRTDMNVRYEHTKYTKKITRRLDNLFFLRCPLKGPILWSLCRINSPRVSNVLIFVVCVQYSLVVFRSTPGRSKQTTKPHEFAITICHEQNVSSAVGPLFAVTSAGS